MWVSWAPLIMHALSIADFWALTDAKSTFQSISTIHIYSVQPTVLQDLNTLTDVCRETATAHAQDDPLECGGQWGMIQNRNVKVSFSYIVHISYTNQIVHKSGELEYDPLHRPPSPMPKQQPQPRSLRKSRRSQQSLQVRPKRRLSRLLKVNLNHHRNLQRKRHHPSRRVVSSVRLPRLSLSKRHQHLPNRLVSIVNPIQI